MSHELRTPLNAILGFTWLLRREEGLSARQAEALDTISRSGSHLLAMIDDILDVARIETGHERLEISAVNLVGLVEDVVNMMGVPARQKGLDLSSVWSGIPVRAMNVDGPKLRQILVNLLGNAVKYTDTGSVTLRVDVARLDETGKLRLTIEVQDTGIGIAPEEQAHIFEPFVQVTRTNPRKGSGLGLAICSQSVRMMGGTIEVVSSPGVGSTFRVELPVEVAKEAGADGALAELESFTVAPDQPRFRILLIEDDEANRQWFARLLEDAGFQVRTEADGEKGIRAFSEWHPHFIWLDIRYPGMDGLEATVQIRALPGGADVKIGVFTASVFDEQRATLLSYHVDNLVQKPATPTTIFECMERLLGVRYVRSVRQAKPLTGSESSDLSEVSKLPGNLKSQLLNAVLLLDKERIVNVIRLISSINPALGQNLSRHAENLEYTPVMHALLSEDAR